MKRLTLRREAIRQLNAPELRAAVGAGVSASAGIPNNCYASCAPWNCTSTGPTTWCVPP